MPLRYDEVYFDAIEQMVKAESEWNNYLDTMVKTDAEMDAAEPNEQAFDILYKAIQDIGTIAQRGIKDGVPGYRRALQKIMGICRGIE